MATIINKNKLKEAQEQKAPGLTANTAAPVAMSSNTAAPVSPQQPASSGSFTNVNKYMSANKDAGKNILNRIGQGVQQQNIQNQKATQKDIEAFKGAVDATKNINTQGTGFQNIINTDQGVTTSAADAAKKLAEESGNTTFLAPSQITRKATPTGIAPSRINTVKVTSPIRESLETIAPAQTAPTVTTTQPTGPSVFDIVNDKDKMQNYLNIIQGAALSGQEKNIKDTASQASMSAQSSLNKLDERQQQLKNQGQRETLLQDFLKNNINNYNRGLMGLDKTFMSSEQKGIDAMKRNLAQTARDTRQTFNTKLDEQTAAADAELKALRLLTQGDEATGAKSLGALAKEKEQAFAEAVRSQDRTQAVGDVRATAQQNLRDLFKELQEGKAVDQRLMDLYGLEEGQRLFNVFKNAQNTADQVDFTQLDKTIYDKADQLATAEERAKYQALAQLAQVSPEAMQILAEGKALGGNRFVAGSREAAKAELDRVTKEFQERIAKDKLQGRGSHNWHSDAFIGGGSGTETASTKELTVKELLEGAQARANTNLTGYQYDSSTGNFVEDVLSAPLDAVAGLFGSTSASGKAKDAEKRAREKAKKDLEKKFKDYLDKAGYGNVLKRK